MQCASISRWLLDCKGITVQEEWLEACIEWILSEEGSNTTQQRLQEMVYEQWLHADLKDIVVRPCIPEVVAQQQRGQINGTFIVQMYSIVDVGKPAYNQLQKLKGQSLDTGEVQEKKFSEPKPTRLLLLQLSDGVRELQAMEYQPIPQLNVELLPGTKLILQGDIHFHLGMLLLSASNVQVLGGQVDHLVEMNRQNRVLARLLNNEELAGEESNEQNRPNHTRAPESGPRSHGVHHQVATGSSSMATADLSNTNHSIPSSQDAGIVEMGSHDIRTLSTPLDVGNIDYSINMDDFEDFLNIEEEEEEERMFRNDDNDDFITGDVDVPGHEEWPNEDPHYDISHSTVSEITDRTRGQPEGSCSTTSFLNSNITPTLHQDSKNQCHTRLEHHDVSAHSVDVRNTGTRSKLSLKQKCSRSRTCAVSQTSNAFVGSVKLFDHHVEEKSPFNTLSNEWKDEEDEPVPLESFGQLTKTSWKPHRKFKVKAHFVKVCQKLNHDSGEWLGTVMISDDFGTELQVHICNEILEPLIGFSAREFRDHINPSKTDMKVRAKASRGFAYCQSAIASLDCLMVLEKRHTHTHPFIVQLLDS